MPLASASRHTGSTTPPQRTRTRVEADHQVGPRLGPSTPRGAARERLTVVIERHGAVGTIVLAGVLDAGTSAGLARALARLVPTRPGRIALDVARLEAIDGSGWQAIRDASGLCRSRNLPIETVFGDWLPSRAPIR